MAPRLRPDATPVALDEDRLQVVLPSGAAVEFRVPGAARRVVAELRAGVVAPELRADLERHAALADGAVDLLSAGAAPLLPRRGGPVRVFGAGAVADATLAQLAALGAPHARGDGPERDGLLLLALDALDLPTLRDANARAIEAEAPLLVAGLLEPRRAVVGPLVVPRETPCLECYLARRATNARSRWLDAPPAPLAPPAPAVAMVASMAALEAARFLRGLAPASLGHAVSVGLDGFDGARDRVLKAPRCPACSRLRATPPAEPWLALPKEGSPRS